MHLDPESVASLAGILGALVGAITFLFRALIESKDSMIKLLTEDRNYWRGVAQGATHQQYPYPPSGVGD